MTAHAAGGRLSRFLDRLFRQHQHGDWWYTLYFPEGLICGRCNTPVVMWRASDTARCFMVVDGQNVPTDWGKGVPAPVSRRAAAEIAEGLDQ